MKVSIGTPAPQFSLPDQNGETHKLEDYKGNWVLIYFYPRDDTPGCTKEACAIRDNYPDFQKLEVKVFGISTDSVNKHEKFVNKYALPFTLLADDNKKVVELYGVLGLKKFMGKEFMGTKRMSFLIDPKGKIAKIYEKVKPAEHAEEVLRDLKEFSG